MQSWRRENASAHSGPRVIVGMAPLTMLPTAKVIVELLGFQVLAKESS